jgi:hypothetical protein
MPSRTQLFQQLPWVGGMNTSLDESMIPANMCTLLDNVIFDTRGSKRKREGIKHNYAATGLTTALVVGVHDYWYGNNTRVQRRVLVLSDGTVWSDNAGTLTQLTVGGTAWTGTLDTCSMLTFNNKCIIAVSGTSNVMKYWDGSGDVLDVPGTPPKASVLTEHIGRIFCNDKENADLLHYCTTGNHTEWLGVGDSGGFPVREGDGDPDGLTGLFSFRGDLFVGKKTKLYRLPGYSPELMQVITLSDSIGVVGGNAVANIGTDDVVWVSEKGVHSLAAVNAYGDFSSSYLSEDIQQTFNEDLSRSRLKYTWAAYLPQINSVAFTFTEESAKNRTYTTTSVNNAVYLYNMQIKAWYRWPDISCQSLIAANDADKKRFYIGSHTGRVSKTFNDTNYDLGTDGTQLSVKYKVQTGTIYPDSNPYTLKLFRKFILYYRPKGRHTVSVTFKVDDISLSAENSLAFSKSASATALGLGFVLGSTPLGSQGSFGAFDKTVDGMGHGFRLTFEQTDVDAEIEIQGFSVEFEVVGGASASGLD